MPGQHGDINRAMTWTRPFGIGAVCLAALLAVFVLVQHGAPAPLRADVESDTPLIAVVTSYTPEYEWEQQILKGIRAAVDGSARLVFHHMDTLGVPDTQEVQQRGAAALQWLEEVAPDAVIIADDNAMRHVAVHAAESLAVPVVFCGVNWPATAYELPAPGLHGMVEVSPSSQLLEIVKKDLPYDARLVIVGADRPTDRAQAEGFIRVATEFGFRAEAKLVSHFEAWERAFREAHEIAQFVYVLNNAGIDGWDDHRAREVARRETRVLSGTEYSWMREYAVVGALKRGEEQGRWAAETALLRLQAPAAPQGPVMVNREMSVSLQEELASQIEGGIPAVLRIMVEEWQ